MPIEIPKPIPEIKILDLESRSGNFIGTIYSRTALRGKYADAIAAMLKLAKGLNVLLFAVTGLEIRGRRGRARGEFSKAPVRALLLTNISESLSAATEQRRFIGRRLIGFLQIA